MHNVPRLITLMGGDKPFTDNGPQRLYTRAAILNGRPWNRVYLSHVEKSTKVGLRLPGTTFDDV
jgi:hypothetical protein